MERQYFTFVSSLLLALAVVAAFASVGEAAGTPNIIVDFTVKSFNVTNMSIGSTVSTYGSTNLIKGGAASTNWRTLLGKLGPLVWRIPLRYFNGNVGSSAGGNFGDTNGAAYIQAIRNISGIPFVVIGGSTNDNDITTSDAASLVHYFNDNGGKNGGPVDYYVIGNEPDNGFGMDNYIFGGAGNAGYHNIAVAMRAATTRRLYLAGPSLVTWADYKYGDFNNFMSNCNADTDIIDFHKYGDGKVLGNINATYQYRDALNWLRQQINVYFGARANQINIQLGEFNYNSWYDGSWAQAFYTSRNLVHTVSTIGQVLSRGGRAYNYADNNGALGLITDGTSNNDAPAGKYVPLPSYWGIAAWTGGSYLRKLGTVMVSATSLVDGVEVYATDNKAKIVLINKSETQDQALVIQMNGKTTGIYSLYSFRRGMTATDFTNGLQFKAPLKTVSSATYQNGIISVTIPWMSVIVAIVD
ncbi:hypothetical protein SAMD00019534_110720 [Acytostelium subglobosum LB1]|uniref:hypothetical protein n=1 Tax=Acytostelium subglobosum LB1 TaxID=1410327 RepID=UPI0006449895|nr:hypothetical protein SAMD00019534_110720 [Acytostelium subglobosum LB1]GAM27896.1 hypothetical protein SAMD00019534_110720 [Acytostelium subglobosum LB1]|eukprot:XP_012749179.1 hypothetical protein SAMD00019534_110720 [Acytostelium subglobosum LB1]